MKIALFVAFALLLAQASPVPPGPGRAPLMTSSAVPLATPSGLVYWGNPAARLTLESRPLGFDVDGNARWLIVTRYLDGDGKPTRIMAAGNVDWSSPDGYLQWQTRLAYGQPAAILKATHAGVLRMTVRSTKPNFPPITLQTDTRTWRGPRVVAKAIGPRMVQIGWFPRETNLVRVVRIAGNGVRKTIGVVAGPSSTYRDVSVLPLHHYRYVVYRANREPVRLEPVLTPPAPPPTAIANAGGKAMWLWFTSNSLDKIYFKHLNPAKIVAQAVRAHLHYVELRVAYGAYWEITPEAKPTIDAIIDGLAAHGIGTVGWTVPRDSMFDDVAASVRCAYYRTVKGTRFTGLAVDLERGEEFMGDAPQKLDALWLYVEYVRQALGSDYLVAANVEDPYLEHLDNHKYPYPQIARFVSVLQPMAYWRMMVRHPTTPKEVKRLLRGSYQTLRSYSHSNVPISIGGQTDAEGPTGAPPGSEITASLEESKRLGAIGEIFFAWEGTQPEQWDAIARFTW